MVKKTQDGFVLFQYFTLILQQVPWVTGTILLRALEEESFEPSLVPPRHEPLECRVVFGPLRRTWAGRVPAYLLS